MKLKGRRQSTNVEDRTREPTIIPDGAEVWGGPFQGKGRGSGKFRWDSETMDSPEQKIAKELLKKEESAKGVPTPSPRPKQAKWTVKSADFRGKNSK